MVHGGIDVSEGRGQLVLGRSDLVVLSFSINSQSPELLVQLLHKGGNPGLDGAVIVVLHLLPFGRPRAEQRAPAEHQILPPLKKLPVDEKIFLFRAQGGNHLLDLLIAKKP